MCYPKSFILFVLANTLLAFTVFSQEATLTKAAEKVSAEIKKNKYIEQIGANRKIAVCLFLAKDTVKTHLGIKLSAKIAHALTLKFNNTGYEVLFPDDVESKYLKSSMKQYFNTPNSGSDEAEYWNKYLSNKKPDYWLTGTYILSADNKSLIIKNVYLKYNEYDVSEKKKSVAIDDGDFNFTIDLSELNSISDLNIPIGGVTDTYLKLINLDGAADLFTIDEITDIKLKTKVDAITPLKIGKEYEIKITLKENAYLYGFYYDPKDKDHNFFDMLFPLDKNNIKPVKAGTISLPENATITIDPPAGEVYIKIIASKKLIPITFEQFKDAEGYTITWFKDGNCKNFLQQTAKLPATDYETKQIIKKVVK